MTQINTYRVYHYSLLKLIIISSTSSPLSKCVLIPSNGLWNHILTILDTYLTNSLYIQLYLILYQKIKFREPRKQGIYDNMVASIRSSINTFEAQDHTVIPRAIVWIQGESDADSKQLSTEYSYNFKCARYILTG